MNIEKYKKLCSESKIFWTQHCLQRMQERDISRADVKNGMIFGYNINRRILHIIAGYDNINLYVITAYYPDTKKFEDDLRTRRKG